MPSGETDFVQAALRSPGASRGRGSNADVTSPGPAPGGTAAADVSDQERLSQDLALFLSNPTLRSALADGSLDLASYSSTVEAELATLESECIGIYRANAGNLSQLRTEMDECDAVLASLQELLLGFQADLAGLSGDIKSLQDQSRTLSVQLKNRRDAELGLRGFLERIVVPPQLADTICTGGVDDRFVQCVRELEEKYSYVHLGRSTDPAELELMERTSSGIPPATTVAGKEMQAHILKLRLTAVVRIREYFLAKFAELRRPRTNVRMIQVNQLLRYGDLTDFLISAAPDVYQEVRDVYIESMGKTLHALFRTYSAQLSRLDSRVATRNDLIAIDDATLRDAFSTKVNMTKRADAFCLADRVNVLEMTTAADRQPILAHVALAEGERYPYEIIFRSICTHLMDAATNEYVFVRQFFKENGGDAFTAIFSRSLSLVLEQTENYLFNCHDAIGILLMIKLTHANRRIMKSRNVDVLDGFFDRVASLLWPRLKMIMDAQIRSVRGANAKKLGGVELHAHYVSRRYAEFTASILLILNKGKKTAAIERTASGAAVGRSGALMSQQQKQRSYSDADDAGSTHSAGPSHRGSAGDMLVSDLCNLLEETVLLLERLAEVHSTNKKRSIFLINNYDQVLCIFQERRVAGKEVNRFAELLMQQRELFVEEELLQGFSKMIAFVQQTESQFARSASGQEKKADVNQAVVEGLVREFATSWKQNIELINRNVLSYFSNFRNGMEILKQVLTQLLLYYTRFQDIVRKIYRGKPPPFSKDLVSTTVILAEIKKYALSI
jgi:hypothetical protein